MCTGVRRTRIVTNRLRSAQLDLGQEPARVMRRPAPPYGKVAGVQAELLLPLAHLD